MKFADLNKPPAAKGPEQLPGEMVDLWAVEQEPKGNPFRYTADKDVRGTVRFTWWTFALAAGFLAAYWFLGV